MVYSKWTHVHTLMAGAAVQAADLLIRSSLGLSILFEDASMCSQGGPGTDPATFPLLDDPFYLLSYSMPTSGSLHHISEVK